MSDINLIPQKQSGDIRFAKALRVVRIVAFAALAITALFSAVVFFLRLLSPVKTLEAKETQLTSVLAQHQSEIAEQLLIDSRLTVTDEILRQRSSFFTLLNLVLEAKPAGVTINTLTLGGKGIHISYNVPSLDIGDQFLQNMILQVGNDKKFSKLVLNDINFDSSNNVYVITLEADLL